MSWDISLVDNEGRIPEVERFQGGGTYALGGETTADFNVTYNYGFKFPFSALHNRTALETIPELEKAIAELSIYPAIRELWRKDGHDGNYWNTSDRNVCIALMTLLNMARQHPDCTWNVR